MVVQMEQRARPGEGVCTVYSANVWVALPTRALHIHTCVPSASQGVSQTFFPICESVWHTRPVSQQIMYVQLLHMNRDNDLEELCADLMNNIYNVAADFRFFKCQSLFWGEGTKYLSKLAVVG